MSFFEFPHTRTYDTDLGWLIKDVTTADDVIKNILQWISDTQPTIDDFKAIYEALISGDLPAGVKIGIEKWLRENAAYIIKDLSTMVFFGVTNDGHFVAYIPESWDDIIFGTTGYDDFPVGIEYGHLTLSY